MAGTSLPCYLTLLIVIIVIGLSESHRVNSRRVRVQRRRKDFFSFFDLSPEYNITVSGQTWLTSGETFVQSKGKRYSSYDGSLKLKDSTSGQGYDKLGAYESHEYSLDAGGTQFTASARSYTDRGAIIFQQYFPAGVSDSSVGDADSTVSGFPSFKVGGQAQGVELGFLEYAGIMTGDTEKKFGRWPWVDNVTSIKAGLDSGPLMIFNKAGDVLITSPFSQFMATSLGVKGRHDSVDEIQYGVMGKVKDIPAGFSTSVIVYYGHDGINHAMREWGNLMRFFYDKNDDYRKGDFSINYLGYWTDNGAYYYYHTEDSKTYQDTMLDVYQYALSTGIPYRYIQYDSWFYYQGPSRGVVTWTARPDVFQDGLYYVYNATGLPVVAHNRWWSDKTTYASKYKFIVEPEHSKSIPVDSEFWDYLMRESRKWGLMVYEQDWLNVEFNQMTATVSDVSLGRLWLRQMGQAAENNGLTVQYCMAPSRHALQSLEIPAVTQSRASGDYHPGNEQWRIGISSIFADALGLAPFKDNFWSTSKQPGDPYHGAVEPYPELQSVVSTLSTGPVGPSDMVGGSNRDTIMRCCNADGLILKPSKPAMAVDQQIIDTAFLAVKGPEIWTTYTDIGSLRFGIILIADLSQPYKLGPTAAGYGRQFPRSKVFRRGTNDAALFSDTSPLPVDGCTKENFCLYYSAPVFQISGKEVILMGELDRWVPVSGQRITGLDVTPSDVTLQLTGASNESVEMMFLEGAMNVKIACTLGKDGLAKLSFGQKACK